MISKVSIRNDVAVAWIPKSTNLYDQVTLPSFDFGRITLEPHQIPVDTEDAVRLTRKVREGNPERGFRFYGGDADAVKRVVKQMEFLQKLTPTEFTKFIDSVVLETKYDLWEVLASLDCDPAQKAKYSIDTHKGTLRKIFTKKFDGFGINLTGHNFITEVIIVNKGEFVWSHYQYKKIDSCNPKWITTCLEKE